MMEDEDDPVIVEGLAVIALSMFDMGGGVAEARTSLLQQWDRLGRPPGVFLAAAAAMKDLPQPMIESTAATERLRPIREMLGVSSADQNLSAALAGRELLEQLAREFW